MSRIDQTIDVPAYHRPETILAHPRFPAARLGYVRAILELYDHEPFLNRLLIETGRSVVFFNILCLHAAYDESDRMTWPTMQLLRQTMLAHGASGGRRVHDIVARFIETGYLTSEAAPSDRRARILTPTDQMLDHDKDWLAAHFTPLQLMFPAPGYAAPMRRDAAYRHAHRRIGSGMLSRAGQLMTGNPAVTLFMSREAGMMILIKLVELVGEAPDGAAHRLSFTDLGSRFGISRTHVRAILRDAEQEDLLVMSDQGVVLTQPLIAAFDRFVADGMAGHDLMFRLAMQTLDERPAVTSCPQGVQTDVGPRGAATAQPIRKAARG